MSVLRQPAVLAALATAIPVFVFALFSFWYYPLGLDGLAPLIRAGSLLVPPGAGAIAGLVTARYDLASASGVGAVAGVAVAWFLTAAVDPRDLGDFFLVAWIVIGALAVSGHLIGAFVTRRREAAIIRSISGETR